MTQGLALPPAVNRPRVYLDDDHSSAGWRLNPSPDAVLVRDFDPGSIEVCYEGAVKAADDRTVRRVRYTLSNAKRDRHRDTIDVAGWQLDSYHSATGYGPVLWSHFHTLPPIGRGQAKLLKSKLVGTAEFPAEGVDEFTDGVLRMVEFGALKACSVGFMPKEYEYNEEERGYDFKSQELLEFSVCNVGAHPDALIAARASGVDTAFLEELTRREMEHLHGRGLWLDTGRLDAVMRGLGLGRPAAKVFRLNPEPLERLVSSRVKAEPLGSMDDGTLLGFSMAAQSEMKRRGLLDEEEAGEGDVADPAAADPAADPEEAEATLGRIDINGLDDLREVVELLDGAVSRLTEALDAHDHDEANSGADDDEADPVMLRIVPETVETIDSDELADAVRRALDEATRPIRQAISRHTGRVI